LLHDTANETDPPTGQGLDQALCLPAIADRIPRRIDAGGERGLRDDAPVPDRGDKVILADDAVAVAYHIFKEIEDLGFDQHRARSAIQRAPIGIQSKILEQIEQPSAPSSGPADLSTREKRGKPGRS